MFKSLILSIIGRQTQPCEVTTDSLLKAYVRQNAVTVYHPTSTCRMESADRDNTVVVDTQCQVVHRRRPFKSCGRLRDVSDNTNAPTIIIAEKVSDMILGRQPLSPMLV
jgi:choline dehydrogenase